MLRYCSAMAKPVPLLLISDHPSASTGLARITRDLAVRIHEHMSDVFRVGVAGYGGPGSRKFGFAQYNLEGMSDWVLPTLPDIWEDFAGDERGILLVIWDLSRIGWLLRPEMNCENPVLRQFLQSKPFQIWTYLPIDASGPNDRLTFPLKESLKGSDRILAYGKWAAGVLDRTMDLPDGTTQYLPHGIDCSVFYPRDRKYCRAFFVAITQSFSILSNPIGTIDDDEILVSIVSTNQARKDFALGIEAFSILSKSQKARLWIKVDALERHYSIPALLLDYGIADKTMISLSDLSDESLAQAYSASDITFGIAPEGFGFCMAESLACGTPCITGSYANNIELVPKGMQVDPVAFRYEGVYASQRPVYNPHTWAQCASFWLKERTSLDPQYDWNNLWPRWQTWLKEGIE